MGCASGFEMNTESTSQMQWIGRIFGAMVDPYARDPSNYTVADLVEALVDDSENGYPTFGDNLGAGAGQDEQPEHVAGLFPCADYEAAEEDSVWEQWDP